MASWGAGFTNALPPEQGLSSVATSVATLNPAIVSVAVSVAALVAGGGISPSFISVPPADDATNAYERDVIGSKLDTIAGNSIIALEKQILVSVATANAAIASVAASIAAGGGGGITSSYISVPPADDAANSLERDVIGSKLDTVAGNSLMSISKQILVSVTTVRSDIAAIAVSVAPILPAVQANGSAISAIAVSVAPILPAVSAVAVSVAAIMPALSSIASGISSESPVPTADTTDNVYTSDVVGNKTDTVAGNSLVAIGKQILASVTTTRSDIAAIAVSVAPILPAVQANGSAIAAIAVSVAPILPAVQANGSAIAAVAVSVAAIMPALSSIAAGGGGGETPVPTADTVDNVYTSDVVGSKLDTVAGNSLMSYSKIIVADVASVATSVQAMASVITSVADFFSVLDTAITSVATSTATLNPAISSVAVSVSSTNTTAGQIMTSVSNVIADLAVPSQNSADNVYIRDVVGNKTDTSSGNSLMSFAKIFNNYFHVQQRVYPNLAGPVAVTSGAGAWTLGASVALISAGMISVPFVIDHIMSGVSAATVTYQINLYAGGNIIAEGAFTLNTYAYCPCKTSVIAASTEIRMQLAASAASYANAFKVSYHYYL